MKKGFVLLFALALFSCNNKPTQEVANDVELQSADTLAAVIDHSNAKNALDYEGIYKGLLPTASGSGMEVTIELGDSSFTKKLVYVGKKEAAIESKGVYSWNKEGNTITLNGVDKPNQYFVGENRLIQLDVDGNRITGEIEEDYVLTK